MFVFQASSDLITASNSVVQLENGAQACNVFWQVGSSATLDSASTFVGTIMALTSATLDTGATVQGRVLARNGAVTLDANTITTPSRVTRRHDDHHDHVVNVPPRRRRVPAGAPAAQAVRRQHRPVDRGHRHYGSTTPAARRPPGRDLPPVPAAALRSSLPASPTPASVEPLTPVTMT